MTASYRGHLRTLIQLSPTQSTVAQWNSTCRALAEDDRQLRVDMAKGQWQPALFSLIDTLDKALNDEASIYDICAVASSATQADGTISQAASGSLGLGLAIKQYTALQAALYPAK